MTRASGSPRITAALFLTSASLTALPCAQDAQASSAASAQLQVYSNGYLERASYRADSSTSVAIEPSLEGDSGTVSGRADVQAIAFISDVSSATVDPRDLFLATSPSLLPHHEITIGRRDREWSVADRVWTTGLWSSRFIWDPFRPEVDGLTGGFYEYHSKNWHVMGFATALSIPDRSYPIRADQGKLSSPSSDWIPTYDQIEILNQNIPINYSIAMPPLSDLILKSGAALSVRYGDDHEGPWAQGSAGVLPSSQLDLAAELSLDPSAKVLDSVIHPRVYYHQLGTFEAGYHGPGWTIWGSITHENPFGLTGPSNWISQPMGPALIVSAGVDYEIRNTLVAAVSGISVDENRPAPTADQAALAVPSRFDYRRASRVSARGIAWEKWTPEASWTHDFYDPSNLFTVDLDFKPKPGAELASAMATGWSFGVGADFITSGSGDGFIGQYVGNDRLRVKVVYAY